MAQIKTKFFGPVEFEQASVWSFPGGLPGFEQELQFLPLQRPGSEPVVFLQSLGDPNLCFVTLPVNAVITDYRLAASTEDLVSLGFPPDAQPTIGEQALCLAILTLLPGVPPSANLMSPVLVNLSRRVGMQVIQFETAYTHRHPIDMREAEARSC